ncbi:MAG: YceI family protein [Candidatus Delongbacteria bacterium]|nr:YceI family protein [Candidatus Delongbacteria bacterium]
MKFSKYSFYLVAVFLLQYKYNAAGQEVPNMEDSCVNHISIHGSSNINQFQLINHNPKIVRLSDSISNIKRDQRIEISVSQFKGANKRIREDFLEMVNASKYPFIIMTIEPRNLEECRKTKGLSDFKTKITIAGVSQRFVVPCGVDTCESSGYVLKGSLEVKLTDFGIDPPKKFFGLLKVNN